MEGRYSRSQLLDLFKQQRGMGDLEGDLAELYVGEGDVGVSNGSTQGMSKWARREEAKENGNGPDICWDRGGGIEPLGLTDLTEEEKEVCLSSIQIYNPVAKDVPDFLDFGQFAYQSHNRTRRSREQSKRWSEQKGVWTRRAQCIRIAWYCS